MRVLQSHREGNLKSAHSKFEYWSSVDLAQYEGKQDTAISSFRDNHGYQTNTNMCFCIGNSDNNFSVALYGYQ